MAHKHIFTALTAVILLIIFMAVFLPILTLLGQILVFKLGFLLTKLFFSVFL